MAFTAYGGTSWTIAENMAWVIGKKGVGRQKERCRMLDDLAVDVIAKVYRE